MRQWAVILLGSYFLLSVAGCAGFSEYHFAQEARREAQAEEKKDEEASWSHMDGLWKQGYGFNNPNNERRRKGLAPVNFDGKTDREREDDELNPLEEMAGNLIGDLLSYGIICGTKAAFNTITKPFRKPPPELPKPQPKPSPDELNTIIRNVNHSKIRNDQKWLLDK